jgi:Protein of unknown function (DUF3180)
VTADPPDEEPSGGGRLRPTTPGAISAWFAVGLVGGWLVRPVAERMQGTAPIVTWLQPLALFIVAAILGGTAWITWRQLQVRRTWIEPHRAVNRFVLARACVLVGALVAGGYFGYAVAWLGVDTEFGAQRVWRSVVGGLAGVSIVITAVLLERACRVRSDDEDA